MKKMMVALSILSLSPLAAHAGQCSLSVNGKGKMILSAGLERTLEVEVQRTPENLRLLNQICNEVHAATHCRGYTLARDEWERMAGDPKPIYVNMGRERAELTIGALPSWIAQFATQNYSKDQNGTYYSTQACESNRSRIAIEVAERAHEVIEDREADEAARERAERFQEYEQNANHLGPKF